MGQNLGAVGQLCVAALHYNPTMVQHTRLAPRANRTVPNASWSVVLLVQLVYLRDPSLGMDCTLLV